MQVWSLIMRILCQKWQKLRKNWWTPKIKSQYWKYSWNPHQMWIKLNHRPLWKYFRKWVYPIAGQTMLCHWIQQKLESKQVFTLCSVSWIFWKFMVKSLIILLWFHFVAWNDYILKKCSRVDFYPLFHFIAINIK